MNRFSKIRWLVTLSVGVLFFAQCASISRVPRRDSQPAIWEPIFFKNIDKVVELAGIPPLREKHFSDNDIEVRIWRDSGPLEGVIIEQDGGTWTANHLIAGDYSEPNKITSRKLDSPDLTSGAFWAKIVDLGILSLPDRSGEECFSRIDGTAFVVEIVKEGKYRTYAYPSDLPECNGSLEMDLIGEAVAEEFYDGTDQCQRAEWFPCSAILKKRRLEKNLEKK